VTRWNARGTAARRPFRPPRRAGSRSRRDRPGGRTRSTTAVGAKRCPPRWSDSQIDAESVAASSASQAANARPDSAQHVSRLPFVQTSSSGPPSCSGLPGTSKSRSSSVAGSDVDQDHSAPRPGLVSARNTRRGACGSCSAWCPGRLISAMRTPAASALRLSAWPSSGGKCEVVSAFAPHGPVCSIASQRPATGAVPASGSPSRAEAALQEAGLGAWAWLSDMDPSVERAKSRFESTMKVSDRFGHRLGGEAR